MLCVETCGQRSWGRLFSLGTALLVPHGQNAPPPPPLLKYLAGGIADLRTVVPQLSCLLAATQLVTGYCNVQRWATSSYETAMFEAIKGCSTYFPGSSHCLPPYRASHSSFDGFESSSHRNAVNESITVRRPAPRDHPSRFPDTACPKRPKPAPLSPADV